MKNTKATRKIAAALAAVMAMTTMATIGASAYTDMQSSGETVTSTGSDINQENAERFRQQMVRIRERQLERLCNKTITVKISNYGLYAAKNIKLYGRKAVGVDHDGNFILGKWEQINSVSTLVGGTGFTASGEYVAFAFSYDVVWGTNFPFIGIFWNKVHWDGWNEIDIRLTGTCRMAGVKIYVGDELAVDESNCSSHKEWKP